MHACIHTDRLYVHTPIGTCVHTYMRTCVHTCIHAYIALHSSISSNYITVIPCLADSRARFCWVGLLWIHPHRSQFMSTEDLMLIWNALKWYAIETVEHCRVQTATVQSNLDILVGAPHTKPFAKQEPESRTRGAVPLQRPGARQSRAIPKSPWPRQSRSEAPWPRQPQPWQAAVILGRIFSLNRFV